MKQTIRYLAQFARLGITVLTIAILLLTSSTVRAQDFTVPGPEPGVSQRAFDSFQTATPWYDPSSTSCDTSQASTPSGLSIDGKSPFLTGNPLMLTYPNVTDEAAFTAAIVDFIKKASPSSPWLNIANLGPNLIAETRTRNVNPMLIVVIARQESQIGISQVAHDYKNSFGNKDASGGYRTWPSFEASLFGNDSFTKAVQDRIGGQHPSYKAVTNMYEYLSVHVSGQIIYPGDTKQTYDPIMKQYISAQGVVSYFTHAEQWIGQITGFTITGIPQRGAGGSATVCGTATGSVNGCTNPFTEGFGGTGKWRADRTDDGVDYRAIGDLPIRALCNGIMISSANRGWPSETPINWLWYKVTSGPPEIINKCIYVAENISAVVPAGTQFVAGQTIAMSHNLNPGTEWGWAKREGSASTNPIVPLGGPYPTPNGSAFARLLRRVGAKTHDDPGQGPIWDPNATPCNVKTTDKGD